MNETIKAILEAREEPKLKAVPEPSDYEKAQDNAASFVRQLRSAGKDLGIASPTPNDLHRLYMGKLVEGVEACKDSGKAGFFVRLHEIVFVLEAINRARGKK